MGTVIKDFLKTASIPNPHLQICYPLLRCVVIVLLPFSLFATSSSVSLSPHLCSLVMFLFFHINENTHCVAMHTQALQTHTHRCLHTYTQSKQRPTSAQTCSGPAN